MMEEDYPDFKAMILSLFLFIIFSLFLINKVVIHLDHKRRCMQDENIGFDGYIGIWILQIYRRYIDEYFYMNIDISEIKLL